MDEPEKCTTCNTKLKFDGTAANDGILLLFCPKEGCNETWYKENDSTWKKKERRNI